MKLFKSIKRFKKVNIKNRSFITYRIFHNEDEMFGWKGKYTKSRTQMYKFLRSIKSLQHETIYVFRNMKGFNTWLQQVHFDVIVLDRDGKVLDKWINLGSHFTSSYYEEAHFVYFMPVGTINFFNIEMNDQMKLKKVSS